MNFKKYFISIFFFSLMFNIKNDVIASTPVANISIINLLMGQTLSSFTYRPSFSNPTPGEMYSNLSLNTNNLNLLNAALSAGTSVIINVSMLVTGNNNFRVLIQAMNSQTKAIICSQTFNQIKTAPSNAWPNYIIPAYDTTVKTGELLYKRAAGKGTPPTPADTKALTSFIGSYTKQPWPTNPNLTEYVQSFMIQIVAIAKN